MAAALCLLSCQGLLAATACLAAAPALADTTPPASECVNVVVRLKEGTSLEGFGPSPALFITARPANSTIPYASIKETVDTRGAPPWRFVLGSRNTDMLVPPEQYGRLADLLQNVDVIISARLDKDGDPNTRDPEDLVGRGLANWTQQEPQQQAGDGTAKCEGHTAVVVLEGRGLVGRMITTRG